MKRTVYFLVTATLFFSLAPAAAAEIQQTAATRKQKVHRQRHFPLEKPLLPTLLTLLNRMYLAIFASAVSDASFLRPAEESSIYGASVGHSLVIPTFTLTNKDRSGSISVATLSIGLWLECIL